MPSLLRLYSLCFVLVLGCSITPLLAQPTIITTSPIANTNNGLRASPVIITFNQPLRAASGAALHLFSTQRGGHRTGNSGQTTVSGNALTFTPTYEWRPGETVLGTLTTDAQNSGGQAIAAARVFQFTTATGGNGQGNFLPPAGSAEPAISATARRIVLGDIDNDGDLDMLTVNANFNGPGTVSVRLNDGAGNFAASVAHPDISVGPYCLSLALGDVDGDGDLDVVTANTNYNGPGTVSVRLNTGSGKFIVPSTNPELAVSTLPVHLTLGDIDGDGDLDIVTAHESGAVNIRLNSGLHSGSFLAPATNATLALGTNLKCVALGDIDGDGDLDLLVANAGNARVHVLVNNGLHSATFIPPSANATIPVGVNPTSLALGDIDGDGDLDLVVGTNGSSTVVNVRLNSGLHSSNFINGPSEVYAATNPLSIALGDVDADGDLDLIAANFTANSASVRINTGSGTFYAPPTNPNFSIGGFPTSLALGDVDGDLDLDLVTGNTNGSASVRLNQSTATQPAPTISSFSPTSSFVGRVITLNGTGFTGTTSVRFNGVPAPVFTVLAASMLTVTVPVGATTGPISVVTPGGTAVSSTRFQVTVPTPPYFTVNSFVPARNARTTPLASSIAVTFSRPLSSTPLSSGVLRVVSTQYGGRLTGTASVSGNTLTFQPTHAFKPGETILASVTRDVRSSDDSLLRKPQVYQFTTAVGGTGRGYYRPGSEVVTATAPSSVAVGDVDGDGDLDVVTANSGSSSVSVRLNGGDASGSNTGVFSGAQEVAVSSGPMIVKLADVDNDGDLDLLTGCEGISNGMMNVRLNGGNANGSNTGIFSGGSNLMINSGPLHLAVGDLDGDGDLDVVTADRYINYLTVLRNNGGVFSSSSRVPAGRTPTNVTLGDVDGDGDLDLLFSNADDGSVYIHQNGGDATGSNTGTFTGSPQNISLGYAPTSLVLGDLDGDNDLDLVVGNSHSSATVINVLLNGGNASGSNTGIFSNGTDVAVGGPSPSIALGDADADGDLDLFSLNPIFNGSIFVWRNDGNGVFSARRQFGVGISPQSLVLGDVDGDEDLDVLTANQGGNSVSIRLNTDGGGVLTSSAATVCAGSNVGILTLSYSAGTVLSYQADSGGGYQPLAGTALTQPFTNLTATTTFRAVVLTPENQTVYSTPVTVTVNPAPVATLSAGGPLTFCMGDNVVLTATGGASYQFLRDTQPIAGATTPTYTATTTGSYTVAVTNTVGCTTTSAAINVTVNPLPTTPTITATNAGTSITLTSSALAGNQWFLNGTPLPGATASTYVFDASTQRGSYTVVVTSVDGCVSNPSLPLLPPIILTASQPLSDAGLTVHPNPTSDGKVVVRLKDSRQPVELLVLNMVGQTVGHSVVPSGRLEHVLDLGPLPAGVYVLRASTQRGTVSRRIIRQ